MQYMMQNVNVNFITLWLPFSMLCLCFVLASWSMVVKCCWLTTLPDIVCTAIAAQTEHLLQIVLSVRSPRLQLSTCRGSYYDCPPG